MVTATAPGKIILFGEHAVVYGRPAIASPLSQIRATAKIEAAQTPGVRLLAPDLDIKKSLETTLADGDAFGAAVQQVQAATGITELPPMTITVSSQIPIAGGLGSGAAITAAVIRALATFLGFADLAAPAWVSELTYEVEKIYHGTPSGIDNTVVAYEKPVYFVRQQPQNRIETFAVKRPLHLLVGDTGISSSTKLSVGDVRRQWQAAPSIFEALFDECGQIAEAARAAIENGDLALIGDLMNQNHLVLDKMTVSSPELDQLVEAAQQAGALGAKLSGGGRGGNMIALVTADTETAVRQVLLAAGAKHVLCSVIK